MKKKFLIYWDYRRTDLLLPFHKLSNKFEWNFIFFRTKDETNVEIPYPCLYWSDFKSPYTLLNTLKPDGIIFSDLSSLYAVSLNIAATNKKIPTYLLDHGIKLDLNYYFDLEGKTQVLNSDLQKSRKNTIQSKRTGKIHALRFYLSALRFKNGIEILNALRLLFSVFRSKSERAFAKIQFPLRCPDQYLLFSKQNFTYYQQRDGIDSSKVIYFGNPYQDEYISGLSEIADNVNDPYYLLLDDGQIEGFGITPEQKNRFLNKLNEFAIEKKARLIVKLHPFDYGRTDLYQHENIFYKESADVGALIIGALGCFAISTSLMFPLVVSGKVIPFKVPNSKIQDTMKSYGVKFLDYLNFHTSEIDFTKGALPEYQTAKFVEQFLYKMDGKSLCRLKELLQK